jgi:Protein of unknown function (DUF3455)
MLHLVIRSLATFACLCSVALAADSLHIPDSIRPAADEELAFVLAANGVQVYSCKPKDAYTYAWSFVAPEATLSENGAIVGRHYAGPTWSSGSDYSSVKGAVREKADGGAGNIPWLLLAGTPAATPGKFANVTSIQRLATRGGVEPTAPCNESMVGNEARVAYTADYYFYKRK